MVLVGQAQAITQMAENVEWNGEFLRITALIPQEKLDEIRSNPGLKDVELTVVARPKRLMLVRIRKVGGEWSPAFETPFGDSAQLTGLDPDAEYEISMERLDLTTGVVTRLDAGDAEFAHVRRVPRDGRVRIAPLRTVSE